MENNITARIEFSFKGEIFTPEITVNLDEPMEAYGTIPNLRQLLASRNNINPYSYEYEVMEATPIIISQAEGMVADHITDDKQLDTVAFEKRWHEMKMDHKLEEIVLDRLGITDLKDNEALRLALLDAYMFGKQQIEK